MNRKTKSKQSNSIDVTETESEIIQLPKSHIMALVKNKDTAFKDCYNDCTNLIAKLKAKNENEAIYERVIDREQTKKNKLLQKVESLKNELDAFKKNTKHTHVNDLHDILLKTGNGIEELKKDRKKNIDKIYKEKYKSGVDDLAKRFKE